MKRFLQTLKNIFAIDDLRNKLIATLGLVLIYRFGAHVVIPGIDPTAITAFQEEASKGGIIALINMFSGGAFANASVFALGIMPYISSSIVIQLLGMAVPYFQRLQREGESGRKKINQITRYLTVLITTNYRLKLL
jgi:preprotein translocase subunit SecY